MTAGYVALIVAVIGLQTFWISRAINKVEDRVDDVRGDLRSFQDENHRDMQTHTEAITGLRERVARLERT